jgi:hypothetical protein
VHFIVFFGHRYIIMVWIVLLLVFAAPLFGLSTNFEAISAVLGFIVTACALAAAGVTSQLASGTTMVLGVFGFFVIVGLTVEIAAIRQSWA